MLGSSSHFDTSFDTSFDIPSTSFDTLRHYLPALLTPLALPGNNKYLILS